MEAKIRRYSLSFGGPQLYNSEADLWSVLVMATGLSRPGKFREGPRTGKDRTGLRDLEGPVVLWSQD